MASIEEKKRVILKNEQQVAGRIALDIIHKPKLNLWMILIPVIFVYYFFGLNRFATGKKEFIKHFVQTRQLILDQACCSLETGEKTDFHALACREGVPEKATAAYVKWAKVLHDHFQKILTEDGNSYQALVKSRYRNQGQFILILNQINKAESNFYNALRNDLTHSVDDAGEVIKKMESSLEQLRRNEAREIFS